MLMLPRQGHRKDQQPHYAAAAATASLLCDEGRDTAPCCMQVPFVDEQRLLTAAKSVPPARLTEAERARNKLGDMLVFEYKDGELS